MNQTKMCVLVEDRDFARTLAGALQDLIEPAPDALTLFEDGPTAWRLEAYYLTPPTAESLHGQLEAVLGRPVPAVEETVVPDLNWVAISQAALPPVAAGRFTVHGSHDRDRIPQGPNAILIDAGEAFGTAHHATTQGCLLEIDRLTRNQTFGNILDLGCGSGVLAIALARALPHATILATDLDAQSVAVAAANMRANGVGQRIATACAPGFAHPWVRQAAPFDLIVANILAAPLIALARDMAAHVRPGGTVVLSGLLVPQAPSVIAAYLAAGFSLAAHHRIVGWSTLRLIRRDA
jgi:ribosomal protein L11 methyltransferase